MWQRSLCVKIAGDWADQVNLGKPGGSLAVRIVQERVAKIAAPFLYEGRSRSADAICLIGSVLQQQNTWASLPIKYNYHLRNFRPRTS